MKKLVLSLALVATVTFAFGQKKVVKEAEKGLKSGNLQTALTAIDAATTNPETSGDPATFLVKAKIHTKIFATDSSNTKETLEAGNVALATFNKTFEMAGSSKTSPVGKEVYAEELPGLPANLRPYSLITLKNLSFDKALERYNEEDMEMSYEFFNLAGEIDKTDSTIHYNAGFLQLLLQLNKMDEAMKQINDALANDPNNPGLLLRSGYLKEQGGDLEGAMADYKKSVEVDPNFFEGNYYTGALLLEKSRAILAELNSLSDAEWEKRSKEMGTQADELYKQAVPYFTKALEIKPDNTDIMIILFQVHTRLKNTAEVNAMNTKISAILGANWQEN